MDRRRYEDSRDRDYRRSRRDDFEDDYRRDRGRHGRDDRAVRNRSRSRSISRERTRPSRSKSPRRDDGRSNRTYNNYRDFDRTEGKNVDNSKKDIAEPPVESLDEDAQLAAFLGITSFGSTKGQKVAGNATDAVVDVSAKKKKREYRQYLFVKGAYDIPLTKDQLEAKEKDQQAKAQHH